MIHPSRRIQIVVGLAIIAFGGYLVMSPLVVADVLGRPPTTTSQMINLRASWGGTVLGVGGLVVWLRSLRPWRRSVLGLLMWAMAGIGLARAIGFVRDGSPDTRQYIWITAEIAIVLACAIGLRLTRKRA